MPRRRPSLVDSTSQNLATLIKALPAESDGWLPPTRELSERLNVSRTVLREAVSRLASQGLLEVRHGVGIRVVNHLHKPVTASVEMLVPARDERLRQSLDARRVLEVELARRAAGRMSPAQLAALDETQQALAQATALSDQVDLDLRFHRLIAEAADNAVLALLLESIAALGRDSRRVTIASAGVSRAVATHQPIIDALRAGDANAAAAAMAVHLDYAVADLNTPAATPTLVETSTDG